MTRSPRILSAVAAPALAVVLALSLSGCDTRQAGAAATVGDRRITVSDVQTAYQDIVPLVGPDANITQTQILNLLILEPYLTEAAAREGRGVSPQDARLDIKAAGPTVDADKVSDAGIEVWRANLANSQLQGQGISQQQVQATYEGIGKKLKAAGVHVNPRYGSGLDYTTFSILPSKSDWLVTPAPTTPAAPGATPAP